MTEIRSDSLAKSLQDFRSRHTSTLGYRIIEIGTGRGLVEWTPLEELANPLGIVHGGYVGVIVDDVCGIAVQSLLDRFRAFPTVSMHVDFVRGITIGEPHVCTGVVVRAGRRITVADTTVTNKEGKLLARGTCTFALDLSDTELPGFSALDQG